MDGQHPSQPYPPAYPDLSGATYQNANQGYPNAFQTSIPVSSMPPTSYPPPGAFQHAPGGFQHAAFAPQQQHVGYPPPQQPYEPSMSVNINPFMAASYLQQAGNLVQGGYHNLQEKMGFLSNSTLQHHFSVNTAYVRKKLLILMTAYLRQWKFDRDSACHEQGVTQMRHKPPKHDVFVPDLYIPFMAFCTYCLLLAFNAALSGHFKPQNMYNNVTAAAMLWLCLWVVMKGCTYGMKLVSMTWAEVAAYSGYTFVPVCLATIAGWIFGSWGYRVAALYGSLAAAFFVVRSFKSYIREHARNFGGAGPSMMTNYLLLLAAVVQFPAVLFMTPVVAAK